MQMMRNLRRAAAVGLIFAAACEAAWGQISAEEGRWVVARGADIASKCADYVNAEYGAKEGGLDLQDVELVRIVTAAPSSWRFYSRDRGILIAIDVGSDVSATMLRQGPSTIARAAEKVIRQEREMSIADRVMVVLIDPVAREHFRQTPQCHALYAPAIPTGQWCWESATAPVGIGAPASISPQACGCR